MIIEPQVVKDFLKLPETIRDFEDNNINNLYKRLKAFIPGRGDGFEIGLLTYILKETGIDPLKYLDHIPSNYMVLLKGEELHIPKNIKLIDNYALFGSEINKIHYDGAEEEWYNVKKGFRWDSTSNSKKSIRVICKG